MVYCWQTRNGVCFEILIGGKKKLMNDKRVKFRTVGRLSYNQRRLNHLYDWAI